MELESGVRILREGVLYLMGVKVATSLTIIRLDVCLRSVFAKLKDTCSIGLGDTGRVGSMAGTVSGISEVVPAEMMPS